MQGRIGEKGENRPNRLRRFIIDFVRRIVNIKYPKKKNFEDICAKCYRNARYDENPAEVK